MTDIRISRQEAADCLDRLWREAFERLPFDAMCSALRIAGMEDAGWDPLVESEEAFNDYNWHLNAASTDLSGKARWRIGLLMYCQGCEISAVHTTLANLLRNIMGEPYHIDPLSSLGRPDKKRMFKFYPPSATVKWRKIRDMAVSAGFADLVRMVDAVYNDTIRNSFSHSDYIITDSDFRWTEGGLASGMPLQHVSNLIANSFDFFGTFVAIRKRELERLAQLPRYHRWPNFEVLELLKTDGRLDGFRVHFSTGASAQYRRRAEGVIMENIMPAADGTIGFMIGLLANEAPRYIVDGQVVDFGNRQAVESF